DLASAGQADAILEWAAVERADSLASVMTIHGKARGEASREKILEAGFRWAANLDDVLKLARATVTAEMRDRILVQGVVLCKRAKEVQGLQTEATTLHTRHQ